MESTTIDVLVETSDYGCCGAPFAVGDELGFTLAAPDSAIVEPGARSTYVDDRHPMDREHVRDVRGRVEAIVAVHERLVRVAGRHNLANDPDDTIELDVDRVPADGDPGGYRLAYYRVRFRIPADTELPQPIAWPGPSRRALRAVVGPMHVLTAVVAEVAERFGSAVDIIRAENDTAVTLAPRRTDAAAVRWNLYDRELVVEVEWAAWPLPWDEDGPAMLRGLVEAAASGGFTERVEGGRFVATATTPDGETFAAEAEAPTFPSDDGLVVMSSSSSERLARARSGRPFPPWS